MPTFDHFDPGNTCWVDLTTSDTAAAIDFYGELFSWVPAQKQDEYVHMSIDDKTVAGIFSADDHQPVTWNTYVAVENADTCLEKAEDAGGKVFIGPTSVEEQGRYGVIADTSGGVICIWESGSVHGVELANEVNTWGYSEVRTTDVGAAQRFYREVFGWEARSNAEYGVPGWSWFLGDKHLGGLMEPATSVDGEPIVGWVDYFSVADLEWSITVATDNGGSLVVPMIETPIGRWVTLSDPQGALFGVAQMNPR